MKGKQILAMALCLILTVGTVGFNSNAGGITEPDMQISELSVSDNSVSDNTVSDNETPDNTVSDNTNPGGTVSDNETPDETVSGNETPDETVSGNETPDETVSGNEPGDGSGTDDEEKDTVIESGGVKYTVNKDGVLIGCENAQGNISIPECVVAIGEGVFSDNSKITSVIYPKGLERIEAGAFENCKSLFMFYTRDSDYSKLTEIGDAAFKNCTALKYFTNAQNFVFSDSVTRLGNYVFQGCTSLKSVTLPKKLAMMGVGVFKDCTYLTDIVFSPNYPTVPENSFSGCLHLTSITWKSITKIEANAFRGCASELYYLELPGSITTVKKGAFEECIRLKSVVIYNDNIDLEVDSFSEKYSFTMYANAGSQAQYYARGYDNIKFVDLKGKTIATEKYKIVQDNLAASDVTAYVYTQTIENGVEKNVETKTAVKGTKLYVQLTIPEGRQLVAGTLKANGVPLTYVKDNVYSFIQGIGDTWLTAEFERTSYTEVLTDLRAETSDDISKGMKAGQTTQIYLFSSNPDVEAPLKLSRFILKSDNTKVVKVSSTGLITAVGKGTASVGIYQKDKKGEAIKPGIELEITVAASRVSEIDLYLSDYDEKKVTVGELTDGKQLLLTERDVWSSAVKIQVKANGYDEEGSRLEAAYKWSTSDSTIVKLEKISTPVGNASNTITVQKGAAGEATVTVEAQDGSKRKSYLRICVQDGTPTLKVENKEFNSYLTEPFVFYLLEAYGYTVDSDTVEIKEKSADSEDDGQSVPSSKFKLVNSGNGKYVIMARSDGQIIPEGDYKLNVNGKTRGLMKFNFDLTFTVKNSLPSAKVKQTGKINLFYTNEVEGQAVKTAVSGIGKNVIDSYALEPLKGSNAQQQEDYDRFTENFQIDEHGVITRKADQIGKYEYGKNKGKAVTKGYLVLHFKGYRADAVKKITITVPVNTAKPALILSKTQAVYNSQKQSDALNEARVQLLDKKTKKAVNLEEGYTVAWHAGKTAQCFLLGGEPSIENNEFVIPFKLPAAASKAVLIISNPAEWGENTLELTFTAKVTSTMPKASLTKSKITLNTLYTGQTAEFSLKANQIDAQLSGEQVFVPAVEGNSEQAKLSVEYHDGVGVISVLEDQKVADGTYKFVCYVKSDNLYNKKGQLTNELNKVTLSVVIKNSKPAVKLKSSNLSLNSTAKGKEEVQTAYTLNYTPSAGSGYQIDNAGTKTVCTTDARAAGMVNFRFTNGALYASLTEEFSLPNGKYKFEITPMFTNGEREIEGSVLKVTLTVHNKKVGVKLTSAKGKVDLLNRDKSGITYKIKISNVNDKISDVKLKDIVDNMIQKGESTKFYAEVSGDNLVIRAKEDAELVAGKTYYLKLYYELAVSHSDDNILDLGNGYLMEKNIAIKPAQAFPKITVTNEDANRYLSNREYKAEVTVTPKKGAAATIRDIVWANDAKEEVKRMFEIEDVSEPNPETGAVTFTVKLKEYVFCKINSTQTLKLAVVYEGQSEGKQGQTFNLKIKVNR